MDNMIDVLIVIMIINTFINLYALKTSQESLEILRSFARMNNMRPVAKGKPKLKVVKGGDYDTKQKT